MEEQAKKTKQSDDKLNDRRGDDRRRGRSSTPPRRDHRSRSRERSDSRERRTRDRRGDDRRRRDSSRERRPRSRSPDDRRRRRSSRSNDKSEAKIDPIVAAEQRQERELALAAEREAARRQREIDDLTKDQRTIFVSQLTKKVDEKNLEDFFSQIGKVKNIIMIRDKFTGQHKGFAYVEMEDLDTIPNCLLFNNVVPNFQKFPILVKASEAEKNFLAKKESTSNASKDSRIYVGNIHLSIDETALKTVLEQFGPVESVKLHRDALGNSKGFAFVQYVHADHAQLAMAALPALELGGRFLKAGPVNSGGSSSSSNGANVPMANSFGDPYHATGNWKLDADEGGAGMALNSQSRLQLMAKLGQGAGITVPTLPTVPIAPATNATAPAATAAAVSQLAAGGINGKPSRCFMISNMFDPATETSPNWSTEIAEDVSEECSNFGRVETCQVEAKKSGGLVYVRMATMDAATKAATALHGRYFAGRMITVSYVDEVAFSSLIDRKSVV